MNKSSAFFDRSCEVAGRFLQSAVVVDDQAHLGDVRPSALVTPVRSSANRASRLSNQWRDPRSPTEDLDAKSLIDAFAALGVVCAVLQADLRPKKEDDQGAPETVKDLGLRTCKATRRSDIVILDWNIRPEGAVGQNAKSLIKEILERDADAVPSNRLDDHSRRLRLIAIYTGDLGLDSIANELAEFLGTLGFDVERDGLYRIKADSVTISVYGKPKPKIEAAGDERRVAEDELPKRLQRDFAGMTAGLLSNAALASLSAVRTNTHRILSRFSPRIDPPYVAHRAMLQPPEEAEEHPVPLIAAEIEEVLADDERIQELVGLAAIGEWLNDIVLEQKTLRDSLELGPDEFRAELLLLLRLGLKETAAKAKTGKWKKILKGLDDYDRKTAHVLTRALAPEEGEAATLDMEFAQLTSSRSRYDKPAPVLKLGTVVAIEEDSHISYKLCVQPVCDSFRIDGTRPFPFLKLVEKQDGEGGPVDFVLFDQGRYVKLKCIMKVHRMVFFNMDAEVQSKSVKASRHGDSWHFAMSGGDTTLRWVADLKTNHAHRAVDQFANEIKRVGLTESEWLRRMARE